MERYGYDAATGKMYILLRDPFGSWEEQGAVRLAEVW
jgi:hypothetical protein